jgi:small subunit ribosomal protein S9
MARVKSTQEAAPSKAKKVVPMSHGVGRRKSSVARAWIYQGAAKLTVNDTDFKEYFDTELSRLEASGPLQVILPSGYSVVVTVTGGGQTGQAGAVRVAIARALVAADETLKPLMRQHGFLTVDSRLKERKKYGQKAARRKFQFVKR